MQRSGDGTTETTEIEAVCKWLYSSTDFDVVGHSKQVTQLARKNPEVGSCPVPPVLSSLLDVID
jgi:hypothetical protein